MQVERHPHPGTASASDPQTVPAARHRRHHLQRRHAQRRARSARPVPHSLRCDGCRPPRGVRRACQARLCGHRFGGNRARRCRPPFHPGQLRIVRHHRLHGGLQLVRVAYAKFLPDDETAEPALRNPACPPNRPLRRQRPCGPAKMGDPAAPPRSRHGRVRRIGATVHRMSFLGTDSRPTGHRRAGRRQRIHPLHAHDAYALQHPARLRAFGLSRGGVHGKVPAFTRRGARRKRFRSATAPDRTGQGHRRTRIDRPCQPGGPHGPQGRDVHPRPRRRKTPRSRRGAPPRHLAQASRPALPRDYGADRARRDPGRLKCAA